MDSLDFEVTDTFAKNMSKKMLPSLSKLKRKSGKKNSTTSTISQVSTASNNDDSFDAFCTASPRGSVWDAKVQATDHNMMRLGFDVLA